jgi:hypothetical protein
MSCVTCDIYEIEVSVIIVAYIRSELQTYNYIITITLQSTSEIRTVRILNGDKPDVFCPVFECIRNPDQTFLTAGLDHFIIKKKFSYDNFLYKTV